MRVVVTILVFLLVLSSTGLCFQNEPGGFGGLKWGDPPTEDMEYWGMSGSVEYYKIKHSPISFAGAFLLQVYYGFHQREFFDVMMYFLTDEDENFEEGSNWDRIKTNLESDFGKADKEYPFSDTGVKGVYWMGERTIIWLRLEMIREANSDEMTSQGIVSLCFISNVVKKKI